MAFLLPRISLPPTLPHQNPSIYAPIKPPNHLPFPLLSELIPCPHDDAVTRGNLTAKQPPPPPPPQQQQQQDDFYVNVGFAVRTLRRDLPALFSRDLNYDIYRDDITFIDPLNTFHGIDSYKSIFWALRLHGRILFRDIGVKIFRVWQPSETSILIRWELQGIPRVPWEARGRFQGTSRYKLDREGKIYEHKVDNLAFNFPRAVVGPTTMLDLVALPATPTLTIRSDISCNVGFCSMVDGMGSGSWVKLYQAVRGTLDGDGRSLMGIGMQGLITCS